MERYYRLLLNVPLNNNNQNNNNQWRQKPIWGCGVLEWRRGRWGGVSGPGWCSGGAGVLPAGAFLRGALGGVWEAGVVALGLVDPDRDISNYNNL